MPQPTLGDSSWTGAAISADGLKATVVDNATGILWTYDGNTGVWTPQYGAGLHPWTAVDISPDGNTIIAGGDGTPLYISTDGGLTWTQDTSAGVQPWSDISVADDNTATAITDGGSIYTYNRVPIGPGQLTPVPGTDPFAWTSVAGDPTGQYLIATDGGGLVYLSDDGGFTWEVSKEGDTKS